MDKEINNASLPHKRDSNLELYRIVVMLLIIAHHYVVNSGLTSSTDPVFGNLPSWRSVFLLVFGAYGKTGINCFVLITGYFMCTDRITLKKYCKLLLEVLFYSLVIYLIFCVAKYDTLSLTHLIDAVWPIKEVGSGFTSAFLLFYLLIPFLNILIRNMCKNQHLLLVVLCLSIYTLLGSSIKISVQMNYVTWFSVVYMIAAYLRLYPRACYANTRLWGLMTLFSAMLAGVSVIVCCMLRDKYTVLSPFEFVADSNKIFAVTTSIFSFLFAKSIKIPYSKWINKLGSATFGVLQIHTHSSAMRTWLWRDLLNNVEMFN